ncbi:MAG: hypothetical protein WCA97_08075 [Terriglobales bacterium]|jgi:mono/diheme cytochrome c family protein
MFSPFLLRQTPLSRFALFSVSTAIAVALASGLCPMAFAQKKASPPTTGAESNLARGKYIVEGVAVCGQCHTPRDSNGNLDRTRWLQGSPVPYLPAKPDMDWPLNAPRIGGTPPASDADMIKLLTTGIWTNGNRLRLPMPQFRMERSDAEAVVSYLRSSGPKQ